jgi:hypothetical protein
MHFSLVLREQEEKKNQIFRTTEKNGSFYGCFGKCFNKISTKQIQYFGHLERTIFPNRRIIADGKKWYFVAKIVLTYCEKKLFW